jgi:hypothetical protein
MGKVTSEISMSLDGFITDPNASVGSPLEGNDPGRLSDWQLQGLYTSNTVIRFTPNKPIPRRLVRKLAKARMAEIQAVDRNEPRLRSSTG